MIQCPKCGQFSTQTGKFCRFCGTDFFAKQPAPQAVHAAANFEFAPPRPYSWKTGEFYAEAPNAPKTNRVENVLPLNNAITQPDLNLQPFQPAAVSAGYHCPRCHSQLYPRLTKRISTAGWIVFAVMMATFFPLFWIGLMIKEDVSSCPVCHLKMN